MMPFIKNVSKRQIIWVGINCCLNHNKSMIGHNNRGMFGTANRLFNKASMVMVTGRVNAFTAPICQTKAILITQNTAKPTGEVSATYQVTVFCRGGPPCRPPAPNPAPPSPVPESDSRPTTDSRVPPPPERDAAPPLHHAPAHSCEAALEG